MRKKILSVVFAATMVASLVGCTANNNSKDNQAKSTINKEISAEEYADTIKANAEVYKTFLEIPKEKYVGYEVKVDKDSLNIKDSDVDDYIKTSILSSFTTSESVKEGVTKSGDSITLDYTGLKDGVAFSGGTATDATYTVGSGRFISDLDKGLEGLEIGKEYDIPCTFPADYASSDLAGQPVVFKVKVTAINRSVTPEFTDDWVSSNASLLSQTLGKTVSTVEDVKKVVKENLAEGAKSSYDSGKFEDTYDHIIDGINLEKYPQEELDQLVNTVKDNMKKEFEQYGSSYNLNDMDSYVKSLYGFESEKAFNEYSENYCKEYLLEKMVVTIIAADNEITVSADEVKAKGEELAKYYGIESYDKIIADYGKTMNCELGYEILYEKVVKFICDSVKEK